MLRGSTNRKEGKHIWACVEAASHVNAAPNVFHLFHIFPFARFFLHTQKNFYVVRWYVGDTGDWSGLSPMILVVTFICSRFLENFDFLEKILR